MTTGPPPGTWRPGASTTSNWPGHGLNDFGLNVQSVIVETYVMKRDAYIILAQVNFFGL